MTLYHIGEREKKPKKRLPASLWMAIQTESLVTLYIALLTLVIFHYPCTSKAMDGREIADMVYNRNDGGSSVSIAEMQLVNKQGKVKKRTIVVKTKDYGAFQKVFLRFTKPADIKGTVFLLWENHDRANDQFIYLPAVKRVRRIVADQKSNRFVNTDFTYEDMQRKRPEESRHKLLRSEEFAGHSCWVLESTPNTGTSQYHKWVSWVGKESLLPLKTEFYVSDNKIGKELQMRQIKKIDSIWTALETEMIDFKRKHTTRISTQKIEYDLPINNRIFTKTYIKNSK